MPRGRPRQPTVLHILRGNPGKRRLPANEPQPDLADGQCPKWLDRHGREFWATYAPALLRLKLLTELDVPMFAAACERWSLYRRSSGKLKRGMTQSTETNGRIATPENAIAKAALGDIRAILQEFGFTPASRAKLGKVALGEVDPLDAFNRKHEQKPPGR